MSAPDPIRAEVQRKQALAARRVRALFHLPEPPADDDQPAEVTTTTVDAGTGTGQAPAPRAPSMDEWVRAQIARARNRWM